MKKQVLIIMAAFNFSYAAGIPTVDVGNIAQAVISNTADAAEYAKQATRWTETIAHYKKQITAYKDELLSKTGIRDLGSAFQDLKNIYEDSMSTYKNIDSFREKVLADPMGFVDGELKEYYNKYMIFQRCNYIREENQKKLCLAESLAGVAELASLEIIEANAKNAHKNMEKLSKKVQNSKDIKESQDLANTLNLQLIALQQENNRLLTTLMKRETEEKIQQERMRQMYEERLGKNVDSVSIMKRALSRD